MGYRYLKEKTIAEQASLIKAKYREYTVNFTHLSLKVLGTIQPTPRSCTYEFELKYSLRKKFPEVRILSPSLQKNSKDEKIPHIYTGEILCLYKPLYGEFTKVDYIADTIIPWTSL